MKLGARKNAMQKMQKKCKKCKKNAKKLQLECTYPPKNLTAYQKVHNVSWNLLYDFQTPGKPEIGLPTNKYASNGFIYDCYHNPLGTALGPCRIAKDL